MSRATLALVAILLLAPLAAGAVPRTESVRYVGGASTDACSFDVLLHGVVDARPFQGAASACFALQGDESYFGAAIRDTLDGYPAYNWTVVNAAGHVLTLGVACDGYAADVTPVGAIRLVIVVLDPASGMRECEKVTGLATRGTIDVTFY